MAIEDEPTIPGMKLEKQESYERLLGTMFVSDESIAMKTALPNAWAIVRFQALSQWGKLSIKPDSKMSTFITNVVKSFMEDMVSQDGTGRKQLFDTVAAIKSAPPAPSITDQLMKNAP